MVKNAPANAGDVGAIPGSEDPLKEEVAPHSSTLAGKSHGRRSLVGYSPWGCKESDETGHEHVMASVMLTVFKLKPRN